MTINHDALEEWSTRSAKMLLDLVDAEKDLYDADADIRQLVNEHRRIVAGEPTWQSLITAGASDDTATIDPGENQ